MNAPIEQPRQLTRTPLWAIGVFVLYAVTVSLLSGYHAISRDEMRALSLARSADNPVDLVRTRLVDEGHPAVWYLLLEAASCISNNTIVLKVVSVLVALTFSGLFFFRSPFPLAHRILFLAGILPLFLFSVMARNYGISAVFLFLIAGEYSRPRESSPWIAGVCNALLANTNIYGAFCAIAIMLLPWRFPDRPWRKRLWAHGIVVVLTGLGGLALAYTVWPSGDNLINGAKSTASSGLPAIDKGKVAEALLSASTDSQDWTICMLTGAHPYERLKKMGKAEWLRPFDLAAFAVLVVFLRASAPRIAFLTAFLIAGVFSRVFYFAEDRHVSVLTLFLLSLLWMQRVWDGPTHPRFWRWLLTGLFLVLSAHVLIQFYFTCYRYGNEPFSQSKNAAQFLATRDPSTILICEPDYFGDALPYYVPNDIYLARGRSFRSYASFNPSHAGTLTLNDFTAMIEQLENETGRPVLLSLPERVENLKAGNHNWSFGKVLKIIPDEVPLFQKRFAEVAVFDRPANETYVFYALRDSSKGR